MESRERRGDNKPRVLFILSLLRFNGIKEVHTIWYALFYGTHFEYGTNFDRSEFCERKSFKETRETAN